MPKAFAARNKWRILAICWITYSLLYMGRVNISVALPLLQDDMGWSAALAGLLGTAYYWVYAGGQVVNGYLGDRLSAQRFVALGIAASALLNLLFGLTSWFPLMLFIWALNGLAQSSAWGPMVGLLSRWFPPEERGRITAIFSPCYVVGQALAWAAAGLLVAHHSWRSAFFGPSAVLLVLSLSWFLLIRDNPPDAPTTVHVPLRQRLHLSGLTASIGNILRQPSLRWALLASAASGMIKEGMNLWGPTFLVQVKGLDITTAALSGTVIPLAGAAGAALGGILTTRYGEGRTTAIGAGLVVIGSVLLYSLPAGLPIVATFALLALMALGAHGVNAMLVTSVPLSLSGQGNTSAAAGTFDFISYVGGGLSAIIVGMLQSTLGWPAVFAFWALAALCVGLLGLRGAKGAAHAV